MVLVLVRSRRGRGGVTATAIRDGEAAGLDHTLVIAAGAGGERKRRRRRWWWWTVRIHGDGGLQDCKLPTSYRTYRKKGGRAASGEARWRGRVGTWRSECAAVCFFFCSSPTWHLWGTGKCCFVPLWGKARRNLKGHKVMVVEGGRAGCPRSKVYATVKASILVWDSTAATNKSLRWNGVCEF